MPSGPKYNPWLTVWKMFKATIWPAVLVALPTFLTAVANDATMTKYLNAHPWGLVILALIVGWRNWSQNHPK
jgi:hypothetical protein